MQISVAIATHNEEKNITRSLASVYNWVDEIIIVDGQSTDATVKIVKRFDQKNKIKIFTENNMRMFHQNKQKAIEKCVGKWILQLDADEVISPQLKNEILSIIGLNRRKKPKAIAYHIPRLNFFFGKPLTKGGQYPDYTIRLYINGSTQFPCKTIHEQVRVIDQKTPLGKLFHPILHYSYPDFETYLRKWIQYASLEANILIQQGVQPSFWNMKKYFLVLPIWWFFKTYIRHKGFQDGFAGFIFALFSSIRYWITYVFFAEKKSAHSKSRHQEGI